MSHVGSCVCFTFGSSLFAAESSDRAFMSYDDKFSSSTFSIKPRCPKMFGLFCFEIAVTEFVHFPSVSLNCF